MKCAAFSGTRNIYDDMEIAAKSLIANSDVDKVYLLIEDDEFPHKLPDIVETINVSSQTWFSPDGANANTQYSYLSMMRVALALMPEFYKYDNMLFCDCDIVVVEDISEIWDLDIDGCYFSACREVWAKSRPGLLYCNTGVALHNLEMMRTGKANELIECLNNQYLRWIDQDALSYLCQGRIALMPPEYNWTKWVIGYSKSQPKIIHYAGRNDWRDEPPVKTYRNMSWKTAMTNHAIMCGEL